MRSRIRQSFQLQPLEVRVSGELQRLLLLLQLMVGAKQRKKQTAVDAARLRTLRNDLKTLSSEFYSLIPHNFGCSLPPVIASMEGVKTKINLLEVLADIEISLQLMAEEDGSTIHPLDAQYWMLSTKMKPLDPNNEEFERIARYLESTEASSQGFKLKIHSVLKIARAPEDTMQQLFHAVDNHKLLWLGSRLSNVVSILSQGLRIAPPEVPKNGYLFSKGIYFADSVSKSAAYCYPLPHHSKGVLLLAEVALGKCYEALHTEYLDYVMIQKRGCASTHGLGRMAPPEETYETMEDGVVVPIGKIAPRNIPQGSGLLYNKFIVYRTEQVKL
uniref:Poly [ADP-ribose] polymerase n=1 Tax=Globisporangium ultimum (strain ATCC 200006 / CBS 805.95 / DAOM BR144) TaxID=431595 RepID=K3W571_GLOUD